MSGAPSLLGAWGYVIGGVLAPFIPVELYHIGTGTVRRIGKWLSQAGNCMRQGKGPQKVTFSEEKFGWGGSRGGGQRWGGGCRYGFGCSEEGDGDKHDDSTWHVHYHIHPLYLVHARKAIIP